MTKQSILAGLFLLFGSLTALAQTSKLLTKSPYDNMRDAILSSPGQMTTDKLEMLQKAYQDYYLSEQGLAKQNGVFVGTDKWLKTKKVTTADGVETVVEYQYDERGRIVEEVITENHVPSHKATHTYTEKGQVACIYQMDWDASSSSWYLVGKDELTYNTDGAELSEIIYSYDKTTQMLYPVIVFAYEYGDNGELLKRIYKSGRTSIDTPFACGDQTEYTWTDGKVTQQIDYVLGSNGETFVPTRKEENHYRDGYANYNAIYTYADGKWKGEKMSESIYVGDYYIGSYQLSGWDDEYDTWASGTKREYADRTDYHDLTNEAVWVPKQKGWVTTLDVDQTRDADRRVTESHDVRAVVENGEQKITYGVKSFFTYNDLVTSEKKYEYNGDAKDWAFVGTEESEHDSNGNLSLVKVYDASGKLVSTSVNTWEKITLDDPNVEIYLAGSMTGFNPKSEYKMKSAGNGALVLNNVIIKKDDLLYFIKKNWSLVLGCRKGETVNAGTKFQLVKQGEIDNNQFDFITLNMNADQVLCKSIILYYRTGELLIELDETTPVNLVSVDGGTIVVQGKKIVTKGAKDVKVYTSNGQLVSQTAETTVEPGLYMVVADGKTQKVLVK